MMEVIRQFIGQGLADYAARGDQGEDALLRNYRQHRVRYGIAIVMPEGRPPESSTAGGHEVYYRFEFGEDAVRIVTCAQSVSGEADLRHRIAASALNRAFSSIDTASMFVGWFDTGYKSRVTMG
jgi:hypothetical protein